MREPFSILHKIPDMITNSGGGDHESGKKRNGNHPIKYRMVAVSFLRRGLKRAYLSIALFIGLQSHFLGNSYFANTFDISIECHRD